MNITLSRFVLLILCSCAWVSSAQQRFAKQQLLNDFDLLVEANEENNPGLYWYISKQEWKALVAEQRARITDSMDLRGFFRIISHTIEGVHEDHMDASPPAILDEEVGKASLLPVKVRYVAGKWLVDTDRSQEQTLPRGSEIVFINGVPIEEIATQLGKWFSSDGEITRVKWSDLEGSGFLYYYYLEYGGQATYTIQLAGIDTPIVVKGATGKEQRKYAKATQTLEELPDYEYEVVNDTTAYLGLHTFALSNTVPLLGRKARFKRFLRRSYKDMQRRGITTLIVDVSQNGGGNEGIENLSYSYLGDNYQKYTAVRSMSPVIDLDNGTDQIKNRIVPKSRMKHYELQPDGSYLRKPDASYGLMAFKKKPKYAFTGKTFVAIGPITYSGGSEFATMMAEGTDAVLLGEETGGAYNGNTSGYMYPVKLPTTGIVVEIPILQFDMKIDPVYFGRGVMPDTKLTPTLDDAGRYRRVVTEWILGQ